MMKNEAGVRIEEMLCQLADSTRIDGEIWRAAYIFPEILYSSRCSTKPFRSPSDLSIMSSPRPADII